MADEWYYWHDANVMGPFSGEQLAGLAAAGAIVPTDTVWKDGVERGVPASAVKYLFPPTPAAPAPTGDAPGAVPAPANDAGTSTAAAPDEPAPTPSSWYSGAAKTGSTKRATAGKGAIIVGQDGSTVKFRKKCTACGFEDSSWRSIAITRGTTRVTFFCPKCRRSCGVEIIGHVS
jgi:hypothetical protein